MGTKALQISFPMLLRAVATSKDGVLNQSQPEQLNFKFGDLQRQRGYILSLEPTRIPSHVRYEMILIKHAKEFLFNLQNLILLFIFCILASELEKLVTYDVLASERIRVQRNDVFGL